jgi:hypothetical protein
LETLFPAYADPQLFAYPATEELFRRRIERGIKINVERAKEYVRKDENAELMRIKIEQLEKKRLQSITEFVADIVNKQSDTHENESSDPVIIDNSHNVETDLK